MCSKWLGFPSFSLVPLMDCWVDGLGLAVRICRAAGKSSSGRNPPNRDAHQIDNHQDCGIRHQGPGSNSSEHA
jgi:hypothetical protein